MSAALHEPTESHVRCPHLRAADEAPASSSPTTLSGTGVSPDDVLELPRHRRMVAQFLPHPDAPDASLHLFYGNQEIEFDEPELFAFGLTLAAQSRFRAGEVLDWSPGLRWEKASELLYALIDAGVLHRAEAAGTAARARGEALERPSPLPPAPCARPRSWADDGSLMAELTGRPLDVGHLELVVPIFRVAHMLLDREQRQVGESNVFPPALRMDVPTRWRQCIYAGTRHQSERPMNVSALKAMRSHWPTMMALLLRVREAYLRRFPSAVGAWTVGHIERLSCAVLALPSLLCLRGAGRVRNGELHPALSNLFRVTDGLRMTMHQMLFVPVAEPTLSPDEPVTAQRVLAYAERNYSFHSEHGVCAGPQAMIAEFLDVVFSGAPSPAGPSDARDPDLEAAIEAIEPALDYALLGLQAYAGIFSIWPAMTRAYEAMADAALDAGTTGNGVADGHDGAAGRIRRFGRRLASHLEYLKTSSYLGDERWRADRERVYADMYRQCGLGLQRSADRHLAGSALSRPDRLQLDVLPPPAVLTRLRAAIGVDHGAQVQQVEVWVRSVATFVETIRQRIGLAERVQADINRLLGRPMPGTRFESRDVDLHNRLQGERARRLPFLLDELRDQLAIDISVTASAIEIGPLRTSATADGAGTAHAGDTARAANTAHAVEAARAVDNTALAAGPDGAAARFSAGMGPAGSSAPGHVY